MHRIDTIDAVDTMPPPAALGTPGFYSDGDVETGRRGTVMSADALNAVQEEICGVIEGVGMPLDKQDNGQLLVAIQSMVQSMIDDQRVGEVFWWPYDTEPDGRAVRVYGQAVGRTGLFAKLFAKSGTKYGAGDGVNTFNLPDPRKYFPRVWDDREARAIGSMQADQNKAHGHTGAVGQGGAHAATETGDAGAHDHTVQTVVAATNPDTQGAADGASNVDVTHLEAVTTSPAPNHRHSVPAVPSHDHPLTIDPSGGEEARPMNIAWPLYIRY
ncbi:tail fiber protein [Cupriavidus oxalaticus]|uniref:Phage tail collar domain-containing protein n=1 Tax=Cupriavidus oxalaticus TaxID=96344 RepID=A0A4P7LUL9_9BURK|nr:tail fiber protein [Cupriavidus oxalaticus]QBY56161.1 hypothetical protein E0W60_34460 [Cupriavidus oxalaticus]